MKKNYIYSLLYQVLILFLPLITAPYISRVLGAEGLGIYSYTFSIANYFVIIAMLGLNNYGNRTIAKVRDDKKKLSKEFLSIFTMQVILSIVMILLYLGYILIFDNKYKLIASIQILYVISTIFDINWFFFGIEKFKLTIVRNTIIKILSLILIFTLIKTSNDVWKYTAILAGSSILSNVFLFPFLKKYIVFTKITKEDIVKHIKPNLVLFLPVIAVSIYKIMDKIMLGVLSNVSEVGIYENAEKINRIPTTIITALGTVMLPRISNMISNKKEDGVKNLIKKSMPFIMFLSFPMMFGAMAIGKDFSVVFFGNEFEKSGYIIQMLSIVTVLFAWGNVIRTQYLIPKEMDKEYIISAFIGAIVNFSLNLVFIPKLASIGACIGTVLAEIFVTAYQSFVVRKELEIKEYLKGSLGFLIKASIMFVIIVLVGSYIDNQFLKLGIQVILGCFLYGIMNLKYIFNDLGIIKLFNQKRKVQV